MKTLFEGAEQMFTIVVLACVIVLGAMCIDLVSGLYKAKQRNEIRSSWGLKRTLNKFILYEGGMMIAAGVDCLIHLSHLLRLFNLEAIHGIPVITCLVGVFLLIVEFISVREAADAKTKTELSRAGDALGAVAAKMINTDELVAAFTKALTQALNNPKKGEEADHET